MRQGVLILGLRPRDFCIFVLYVVMLCVFIPFHEPWVDEAQAWLLSRDLSLSSLLFHHLRHEGHPALWYVLLWILTHLGCPYSLFCWFAGAIAAGGIWLLLRYAPFPFYLRALLPFTFFLAYQYAIVARSYVLFPLLGFLTAHFFRQKKPIAMAVVLALLANVSLHGTLVAIAFASLYAVRLFKLKEFELLSTGQMWKASALFVASILFVAVCLWPTTGALPQVSPKVTRFIDRISIARSESNQPPRVTPSSAQLAVPASSVVSPISTSGPVSPGFSRLRTIPLILGYAFAKSSVVALLFDLTVLIYLTRRRVPALILPALVLAGFLVFVYSAPWHLGLLWITMLMVIWAAWDESIGARSLAAQNAVAVFLTLLCVLQLPWTVRAFAYDLRYPTSPNKALAVYLHSLRPGARIAGFGMSVGVQPYFPHNIFFNQPVAFGYLGRDQTQPSVQQALAEHPDLIVADRFQIADIEAGKYRIKRQFCGAPFFPNRPVGDPGCLFLLKPPPAMTLGHQHD